MLRGIAVFLFATILLVGNFFSGGWFARPCTKPISYSLGSFDRRFGVTEGNFLKALTEAEALWERPSGLDLFASSTQGKLQVNLVYDYRQQTTQELSVIEGEVKEDQASYQTLEASYRSLKSDYAALKSRYDAQVRTFNEHNAQYEASVEKWNSGSRTSRKEFEALESERRALEAEANELKGTESQLNNLVREINTTVTRLNTLAKELNLNVREYNAIGAERGETFTGGTYTADREGRRIDVFEFSNHEKLVRVLAHELGHALGLEHVVDPQAIMYEFNEGDASKLTSSDLAALKVLCGIN